MARQRVDKELQEFRDLMAVPDKFEDGFNFSSFVGAVFIALVMVPGAIYMSLLAGIGVGPAARWVTVILFIETARRAHKKLSRPEIFVLFHMAGFMVAYPFWWGILWNQFFVTSTAAKANGIAHQIPIWYAPQEPLSDEGVRTIFQWKWVPGILMIIFFTVVSRVNNIFLGYGLFRITSDIENLPFPLAPVGAQGVSALAEEASDVPGNEEDAKGRWRWRIFSLGGVLGLAWGAIYLGLPTITGALFKQPVLIFPIPFSDWMAKTEKFLPAVPIGMNWDAGQLIFGMVLPFYAMLGSFIAYMVMIVGNVGLYRLDILKSWQEGDRTLETLYKNQIDFYFSFGIGLAIAIAIVGIWQAVAAFRRNRKQALEGIEIDRKRIPPGRGDLKPWLIGTVYVASTIAYIAVSHVLLEYYSPYGSGGLFRNRGLLIVMLVYGFVYTPLISYVQARLEGMAGQVVHVPLIREAGFILSGYRGVEIWFLPIPLHNYGMATVFYRQAELTGTKFWSLWKAEMVLVPTVLISSILFANFIWGMAPVPSAVYPFADKMWEYQAKIQCIMFTATLGLETPFKQAINGWYIGAGAGVGMMAFIVLGALHAPVTLMYGFVRGLNMAAMPHVVPMQFLGACIGRFYFQRKLGATWRQYAPVVAAGFMCGQGLVSMLGIGVTFLAKAVFQLPF